MTVRSLSECSSAAAARVPLYVLPLSHLTATAGLDHPHVGSGHGASVKVFGAFGKVAGGGTSGDIWPIVPKREPNLKLCLFDSTDDMLEGTINVYQSSLNLKRRWEAVGNAVEAHFTHGGSHTYISSLYAMLACLDDWKNVLVGNSSQFSEAHTA